MGSADKAARDVQIPGGDTPQIHPALTALNNADMDFNAAAIQHEQAAAAATIAGLLADGKFEDVERVTKESIDRIKELRAAGPSDAVPDVVLQQFGDDGEVEAISIPTVRRSPDVDKYGPELPWPAGTPLNAERKPCEGGEPIAYYVSNIQLKNRGWLVSRAVAAAPAAAA